jgi:FHA domain
MERLIVTSGPGAGQERELVRRLVIGREGADLNIEDPEISRRHTLVEPIGGAVLIEDLSSLNGTFVNDQRINGKVQLTSGGKIRVGRSEIEVQLTGVAPTVVAPTTVAQRPANGHVQHVAAETAVRKSAPPVQQALPPTPAAAGTPAHGSPAASRAWLRWALPLGVLGLGGVLAAILVLAFQGGAGTTKKPLTASLTTALLQQSPTRVTFGGTVTQSPGGQGAVVGHLTVQGDLSKGKPVPIVADMVFRFEDGRIDATVRGQAIPKPDRTTDLVGTGTIDGGSGSFEGATGSFTFRSGQEPKNPTVGHPRIKGTIEY